MPGKLFIARKTGTIFQSPKFFKKVQFSYFLLTFLRISTNICIKSVHISSGIWFYDAKYQNWSPEKYFWKSCHPRISASDLMFSTETNHLFSLLFLQISHFFDRNRTFLEFLKQTPQNYIAWSSRLEVKENHRGTPTRFPATENVRGIPVLTHVIMKTSPRQHGYVSDNLKIYLH